MDGIKIDEIKQKEFSQKISSDIILNQEDITQQLLKIKEDIISGKASNFLEHIEQEETKKLDKYAAFRATKYYCSLEFFGPKIMGAPSSLDEKGLQDVAFTNQLSMQSKVFFLDNPNLLELLMLTKNQIGYRHLPFDSMFFSKVIDIGNCRIFGFFLTEQLTLDYIKQSNVEGIDIGVGKIITKINNIEITPDDPIWFKEIDESNKQICLWAVGKDYTDGAEFYINYALGKEKEKSVNHSLKEFDYTETDNIKEKISILAMNLLDFINNETNSYQLIKSEKNKNESSTGLPLPKISYTIRIIGELKKYLNESEKTLRKYSHKFWVRGHWRHFYSKVYKNKFGQKTWIYPYVKGQGILINKNYLVSDNKCQ